MSDDFEEYAPLDDEINAYFATNPIPQLSTTASPPKPTQEPSSLLDELRKKNPFYSLYQYNEDRPQAIWAIRDLILTDTVTTIYGAEGSKKTFIAIDMACHVTHGLPWLGKQVKQAVVLYVLGEGATMFSLRVDAWHKQHNLRPDPSY